jgi:hypothetical protein
MPRARRPPRPHAGGTIAPGAPTDRNDGGGRAQHVQCMRLSTERQLNGRLRLCTGSPWLEVAGGAIRFSFRSLQGVRCRGDNGLTPRMRCSDANLEPIGNVKQKQAFAGKVLITLACCLCNTCPKTRWRRGFRAVPLLLVQGRSVIVLVRRRGASRSRPVFKSCRLRPSRSAGVSEGAMRLKRGPRGQGNQPQGVSPNGIRNLP